METDERQWQEWFNAAADHQEANIFDVAADVERGRRKLRRTKWVIAGSGGLAAAVILGTGFAVASSLGSTSSGSAPPFAATGSATAVPDADAGPGTPDPITNPEQVKKHQAKREAAKHASGPEITMANTLDFRLGLYDVVADHLDPAKKYLNYSTRSLQAAGSMDGEKSLGIKLGWAVPGHSGEGMVQISVSNITGPDADECGLYSGTSCAPLTLPDGRTVRVGETGDGTFEVSYRQPDGVTVDVIVSPLFGNNSVVPVKEMGISKQDVFALVQDRRLNLPG